MTATGPKECPNAGGDAAQTKHRQESIEAFRTPRPLRQDIGCKVDLRLGGHIRRPITHLLPPDLDRPDPGLDHPLWPGAVPNHALAAIGEQVFGKPGDKAISFNFNRLLKKSLFFQDFGFGG